VTAVQRRWRLDLAYRGQDFHGFAAQPGTSTVAGALAGALATVLRLDEPPRLVCAGRTDAGVHALGQVVHVDLVEPLFADDRGAVEARLTRSCNRLLAPSIVVTSCQPAPDGFDARHSACSRSYRYLVFDALVGSPLLEGIAWRTPGPLDVRAMTQAAYAVLGEHDFRAFCRRPSELGPDEPIIRRVLDVAVGVVDDALGVASEGGTLIRIDVTAQSFCHQMVRSIVAVLVEAGRHALSAADVTEHLRSGERSGLPAPAPPEGLCLMSVAYG
jgi:tRNA pseudouridine38-40 synthase